MAIKIVNETGKGWDTRVFYLDNDGKEIDISDCIFNSTVSIPANGPIEIKLEVLADKIDILADKTNFVLGNSDNEMQRNNIKPK